MRLPWSRRGPRPGRADAPTGPTPGTSTRGGTVTTVQEAPATEPPAADASHTIQIPRLSPFRIGFFGTFGVLLAYGLSQTVVQARSVLLLIVVAFFIALGLNPLVQLLERRRVPRVLAVVVVFAVVVAAIAGATWAVVPVFSDQIQSLITNTPDYLDQLRRNPQVNAIDERFQVIDKAIGFVTSGTLISKVFGGIVGAGRLVVGAVFTTFTLLILTLYFLISLPTIKAAIFKLAPASKRERVADLAEQVFSRVGAYLSGMFVVVTCAGVSSFIFLWAIGMREYAIALAVVVAILDFIPMVGATLAAVVVCLVVFVSSPSWVTGVIAIAFYVAYQQFENYVVYPRVMQRSVAVPGAVTVVAALLGATLLGVVGAMLAVPTAAAILLLMREVLQPKLDRL
ncbi:MAG: AI-2E family transporter [Propionibacteriaceae bacterium]